jgi:hypothetical protein
VPYRNGLGFSTAAIANSAANPMLAVASRSRLRRENLVLPVWSGFAKGI